MQNAKFTKEHRAQYWREVIERASRHPVSCHAYCVEEGIPQASFYSWRNRLSRRSNETKALTVLPSFAEVRVSDGPNHCASARMLPSIDAKWVAELILHLQRGLR